MCTLHSIAHLKQHAKQLYLLILKSLINIQHYGIFKFPVNKLTVLQEKN
jgi:hypothetical protein